jgi:NADH oxidoreductase Hcr
MPVLSEPFPHAVLINSALTPDVSTPLQLSLVCQRRIEETRDTATFQLTRAQGETVSYKPGQFMVVDVEIDGSHHHRAYSLSSTPSRPDMLAITVKRVEGGLVSNHLLDHLNEGGIVKALPPAGQFYFDDKTLEQVANLPLLFVSAGCGITPVMSMSRYLLDTKAQVTIHFIHCARTLEDVIFLSELLQMAAEHPNFKLALVLCEEASSAHRFGLLDHEMLLEMVPDLDDLSVYTCGPQPFMAMLASSLERRGFTMARFFQESFTGEPVIKAASMALAAPGVMHRVSVPVFGKTLDVAPESTLLDALEREGLPIIAACRAGVCGSCKCKVIEGEVDTSGQIGLSETDKQAGYVLACSTQVTDDLTVELG